MQELAWIDVLNKLASGAWTLEQAVAAGAAPSVEALITKMKTEMMDKMTRTHLKELIAQAIKQHARRVAAAAAVEGAAGTAAGTAAGWSAGAILGTVALVAALGVGVYLLSDQLGTVAGGGSVQPGERLAGRDVPSQSLARAPAEECPPVVPVKHMCPWVGDGYTIEQACAPGFCFDGGPRGTGACKQENTDVPNARGDDLRNIFCPVEYPVAIRDPCTNELLRCDRE